jgi:hypothetical protein
MSNNVLPVHVNDAPLQYTTFEEKLSWACRRARVDDVANIGVILPGGKVQLDKTFKADFNTGSNPSNPDHLVNGLKIIGNDTVIEWAGDKDQAMFDFPSPNDLTIEGPLVLDGMNQTGVIGIHISWGAYANRNGGFYNTIKQVEIRDCYTGFYMGHMMGPDHRDMILELVRVRNSSIGYVFEGANIANVILRNCGVVNFCIGVESRAIGNKKFEDGDVQDPWGNPYAWDEYTTDVWQSRVDTRSDGHYAKGGAPNIKVENFLAHSTLPQQTFAFYSDGGGVTVRDCRIEGPNCSAYMSDGGNQTFATTRLVNTLDNVSCHGISPNKNVEMNGGKPLRINSGFYEGEIHQTKGEMKLTNDPVYNLLVVQND